jgi:hypothetical protein
MYQPNSKLTKLVDAAVEPVSLDDAKAFLRLEVSDDDATVTRLMKAARKRCEQIADRSFITTTWQLNMDFLPLSAGPFLNFPYPFAIGGQSATYNRVNKDDGAITLPRPPLINITSISYINMGGTVTNLDVSPTTTDFILSAGTPGRIYPPYGKFFPWARPQPQSATIVYASGYGPDATTVPETAQTAILFLLSHMYEHRTDNVEVPSIIEDLLQEVAWGGYS